MVDRAVSADADGVTLEGGQEAFVVANEVTSVVVRVGVKRAGEGIIRDHGVPLPTATKRTATKKKPTTKTGTRKTATQRTDPVTG